MKITTIKSDSPKQTKPYAIEFANEMVVLIVKERCGIVIKQGTSKYEVGTFRNDWCIENLTFQTAEIWHGKIEIEL